jgi:acyl dehydratase
MTAAAVPYAMAFGAYDEAKTFLGASMPPQTGDLPVNVATIRQFCGLVEDANPSYWDADVAARCWGDVISPPAMLLTWGLALDWKPGGRLAQPPLCLRVPLPGNTAVNVSQAAEFAGPILVGEQLSMTEELVDLSEERRTRLGAGHFVTTRATFRRPDASVAAHLTNVLLRFTADRSTAPEPAGRSERAPNGAAPERLPGYELAVPYRKVVTSPAATLDYFPVFYDTAYARAQGLPGVIVNTMVLLGLADRLVTDWAGPATFVAGHQLTVIAPVCAGDTVAVRGCIRGRQAGLVTVDVEILRRERDSETLCGKAAVTARVAP